MVQILTMDNNLIQRYKSSIYKNRYLIVYVVIGILSLLLEQSVINLLNNLSSINNLNNSIGFIFGVTFAFILNAKFNFKVPRKRLLKSMTYFFVISYLSFITQIQIKNYLQIDLKIDRYLISGFLFFFFYLLHRKLSFKSRKEVGVAIHLNDSYDIKNVYQKIGNYADFLHLDLIDETINKKNVSTDLRVLEQVIELWPNKDIQLHLMSTNYDFWIPKLEKYKIKLFVHDDTGENIMLLKNKYPTIDISLVITKNSNFKESLLKNLNEIICLCINNPGTSGQLYSESMNTVIQKYIKLKNIYNFEITLDGGITNKIASKFEVDKFVSASYILNSMNSIKNIVDLQTANKYKQNE